MTEEPESLDEQALMEEAFMNEVHEHTETTCDTDGTDEDIYGGEHYWHCERLAVVAMLFGGGWILLCEEHAEREGLFDPPEYQHPEDDVTWDEIQHKYIFSEYDRMTDERLGEETS